MKKLVSCVLAVLMLASAFGFAEDGGMLAGGWQVGESANQEVMEGVNKALEGFAGTGIETDLLVGTQLVAGTNYCFLSKVTTVTATPVTNWALVYFYIDLEGNSTMTRIQDLTNYGTELAGGFSFVDEYAEFENVEQIVNALYTGEETFECLRILGTQVVAGINYKMFCVRTDMDAGMLPSWALVTVYVDLEGNASIIDVEDVELSIADPIE